MGTFFIAKNNKEIFLPRGDKIGVASVVLEGELAVGDTIHIRLHFRLYTEDGIHSD
jgi:hypothetical protein